MRIGFWIKNARNIALPQSLLPCLTAIVLCIGEEGFVWWLAIPVILGVCAAHLGMNLADDYFDYKHDSRTRADISSTSIRARMEKCHYLEPSPALPKGGSEIAAKAAVDGRSAAPVDGRTPQSHSDSSPINKGAEEVKGERLEEKATLSELGWAIVGFLAFAAAMGGIVLVAQWLLHGWQATMGMVIYAILGLIIGINYSGKPLELGYHGLGELVIGMMFGPLLMLGVQAALTGNPFTWEMLCMSVGIGCMVTNIVYVHSVMEVKADAELGKMTFARLLKSKAAMVIFIGVFAMMPFVMLGLGIAMGWWSAWYLLTLATLPMSVYLIHSTRLFAYGLPREDTPHWWMGPMGNWEGYKKVGIDWFLYRWLLARNICTFFCLILMIVCCVFRG
jgi:1,4-dihydroxy-2-naphthoate octaprenyltransferase